MHLGTMRSLAKDACWPTAIALVAFAATVMSLDPAGEYPNLGEGPGLTIDETYNFRHGALLVQAFLDYGFGFFHSETVRESFGILPDHPPLGRWCLGWSDWIVRHSFPSDDSSIEVSAVGARVASAAAFGLVIALVGFTATRWYGRSAGIISAIAIFAMPRLFGHAHIASLESIANVTYLATILAVAHFWNTREPPRVWIAVATGVLLGTALLTKMQAVFIPVPIAVWALCRWKSRAILPIAAFGLTGCLVFFIGWQWMWLDPVRNVVGYFERAVDRAVVNVWYFNERIADRDVPWHYPFVMFLVTVPIGLHALAIIGVVDSLRREREPSRWLSLDSLVLASLAFPLVIFAVPGITVYDGVRLFLMSFPLWAMFAGRGGQCAYIWLAQRIPSPAAIGLMVGLLATQFYGVISLHPFQLSYHNVLVGGLAGAERLGFEPTYWSDSLNGTFFERVVANVPPGSAIHVVPVMHVGQLSEMEAQSPILRRHGVQLKPLTSLDPQQTEYVMFYWRKADLTPELREGTVPAKLLAEIRREGVQLAALYELSDKAAH